MAEIWKDIRGFPGYKISSEGRVSSCKNFRGELTNKSHLLKPRTNPNGYKVVSLYNDKKPSQLSVHRLVAQTFMSIDDDSLVVDHLDDDKTNNSVDNLEWVTSKENSIRACNNGLYEPAFIETRKPVIATDLWTGETIYFKSVNDAARTLKLSAAIISRTANMICERAGHYTFEFADRDDRLLYQY